MTKFSLFLCGHLVVLSALFAGDSPPDMERLRDSYDAAVDRAVTPLTRTYLSELAKMRDSFTRSANLKAANAVDAEIQAVEKKTTAPAGDAAPEMNRLRDSYKATIDRAVSPLTRTYLGELTKIRDSYTRSANLKAATAVDVEIQAITKKITASGGMAPVVASGQNAVLDTRATIPANDPNGFRLGPVRKGDRLTLTYISGLWKDHGGIATENPDAPTKDNKSQLVIAAPAEKGLPGSLIKLVPPGTAGKPFVYEVQTNREEIVLRINANSEVKKNPGQVIYQVTLTR